MKKGRIYGEDNWRTYLINIKYPFHDTEESFEIYEWPDCGGHFLVECDAMESVGSMWCPYCRLEFIEPQPTVEQIEAQFAETGQYPDWRRMEERGDLDE